ncbi:MAG TPA: ATP-dependent 6-phosphofructokinase [Chthonomonadales bacterium]|nr:ATP-dependent 6-phosphofructokinase [Chthonomonadales bacterium]
MATRKARCIGILTSGGDCPGLNAAIRGVAKTASGAYGMEVIGILDGFTGLVENRVMPLTDRELSGLLTLGGTILGTSRNKPHKYPGADGTTRDMTGACVETYRRLGLDCLVCIGGGGTARNALQLKKAGLNVVNLPKTIDNDVGETDVTFGYDSAMAIATEAIDRLHSTASSHQRIMLVDLMGHNAGWLALGASIAGGADVCLIPEVPFHLEVIVDALRSRRQRGRRFSIVSIAEGARPANEAQMPVLAGPAAATPLSARLGAILASAMEVETRVTTLGHVQRGGMPSPTDRILATRLGVAAAKMIAEGQYGVMAAVRNNEIVPVALEKVAGSKKTIPLGHPLIETARLIGICLGDWPPAPSLTSCPLST